MGPEPDRQIERRVEGVLKPEAPPDPEEPPPSEVLERLREGLRDTSAAVDAGPTLRLAEAVRVLALRYGPEAVEHCTRLVEGVHALLDGVEAKAAA